MSPASRKLEHQIFTEIAKGLTGRGRLIDLQKLLSQWRKEAKED